ncbi:MAG: TolC family protein [Spirochaetes bacterium]|nr:TolC family protein [Spirochaetota bacterium]
MKCKMLLCTRVNIFLLVVIFVYFFNFKNLHADNFARASLSDCLQIALQNNINIKMAMEDVNTALLNMKITQGSNNIQVNGTVQTIEILKSNAVNSSFNVPGKDTLIGLFVGAQASYKLYDANKNNYERLRLLEYNNVVLSALKVKNNVIRDVKIAYYQLAFAKKKSELLEKLVKSFEIKYANVEQLFKNGQRTMLDVSKAQVDLTNAQLNYQRAQNEFAVAKNKLLSLMGIQIEPFDIDTTGFDIDSSVADIPHSLDELLELASQYSFDIKSAEINQEIAKTQIDIEKDKRFPVINIIASLGYENRSIQNGEFTESLSDKNNWKPTMHAGVTANFPIFTSGVLSSSIDRAAVTYNKAMYNSKTTVDTLQGSIKSYYTSLKDMKVQLNISRQLIENAKKYLDLVQKNYDRGIITQNELQDAELNYINATIDFVKILTDYYINYNQLISLLCIDENILFSKEVNAK